MNLKNNNKKRETTKTKTKTKQTMRTGTESEKWTSHRGFSVGNGRRGIAGERYTE